MANYLPSGITATGSTAVTVTVKITATTDRNFTLGLNSGISLRGAKSQYRYSMTPETVSVSVQGLATDLLNMNTASLGAYVEVASLGEGVHLIPLHVTLPKGVTATAVPEVTITVSSGETESRQSTESSSESAGSESSSGSEGGAESRSAESGSSASATSAAEHSTGESSSGSTEETP